MLSYYGTWKENEFHGKGRLEYRDRQMDKGVFIDGYLDKGTTTNLKTASGTFTGSIVDGSSNDSLNGQGRLIYSDENEYYVSYDGNWRAGLFHGKGVLVFKTGDVYDGEFVCGCFSGVGTFTDADGGVARGLFVDGVLFNGKALNCTLPFGDVYPFPFYEDPFSFTGPLVDGMLDGHGKITTPQGGIVEGCFVKGLPYKATATNFPMCISSQYCGTYTGSLKASAGCSNLKAKLGDKVEINMLRS